MDESELTEEKLASDPKCALCKKTVYVTERLATDTEVFHKKCFRCTHCNNVLKLGNYASLQGKYYCKPHFKQLFAQKGNYNEGFGEEKLQHKWAKENAANSGSSVGSESAAVTSDRSSSDDE
eukprot:TRINITY_DN542_c0_g1_i2.p3 TRINITY_DN542_c0_g1~~TRINITY_DN542_c0_g1_i2.p3  ORF type:complete len:122 (+),score=40.83 TRINITY_DN542_c0_g1_i2:963-1328(+)